MTTHTAHWDDAIAAPRPIPPALARMAVSFGRFVSQRKTRALLSDMDDHMLLDIGVDPHSMPRTGQTAGWIVEAQTKYPSLTFLGH